MVPEFVCCPAAATGCRHCLPAIRRESCGFEETSRSNLWRLVSCAIRRQQVGAGSACRQRRQEFSGNPRKTEEFGDSNLWSPNSCAVRRQQPGAGTACPQSAGNPADSKKPAAPIYGGWFRVLFGGSKWNRALPGGSADRSFPGIPENRRIRGLQSMVPEFVCCPAAASGTGHCPAAASGCRLSLPG